MCSIQKILYENKIESYRNNHAHLCHNTFCSKFLETILNNNKAMPLLQLLTCLTGAPSRIFVTIPRFDEGRPMTLGTVDVQGRITAYPDYGWHTDQGQNCQGLTSVFRVAVSIKNYLDTFLFPT